MNITEVVMSLEKYLNKVEIKNFNEIRKMYLENKETFTKPFLKTMDCMFQDIIRLQECGKKGKVAYISFSMLYSNLLLDKNSLRIDIYDSNYVCDDVEVVGEWTPEHIFDRCKDDMDKAMRILSSDYIRVEPYEHRMLYQSYVADYYLLAVVILRDMLPMIKELKTYQHMQKEEEVVVIYGEYMDKGEKIYSIVNEE